VIKRMFFMTLKKSKSDAISIEVFNDVVQDFMYKAVVDEVRKAQMDTGSASSGEGDASRRGSATDAGGSPVRRRSNARRLSRASKG